MLLDCLRGVIADCREAGIDLPDLAAVKKDLAEKVFFEAVQDFEASI